MDAYRLLLADVYELAGLSRRVSEREAGAEGSTAARWHVLSVVSDEPMSVPDIARRLGQVRQGVQRVVDELADEGRVVREPNPAHTRSPLVSATDSGQTLLDRLWDTSEVRRRRVLDDAGLDDASLEHCREALRRLTAALRRYDPSRNGDGPQG